MLTKNNSLSVRQRTGLFLATILLLTTAFCVQAARPDGTNTTNHGAPIKTYLDGLVVYRERMALPANAELLVTISERPTGKKTTLISELRLPTEGRNVPLPFRVSWEKDQLPLADKSVCYELEARILTPEGVLFATPEPLPLTLTENAASPLVVMTRRFADESPVPAEASPTISPAPSASPATEDARVAFPSQEEENLSPAKPLGLLPALFSGEKDGATVSLYLSADHGSILSTKKGQGAAQVEPGRWRLLDGGTRLQVAGTPGKKLLSLALKSVDGKKCLVFFDTALVLKRDDPADAGQAAQAPGGSRRFVGQFRAMADAATLRECTSGVTYAVERSTGYPLLEQVYMSKRRDPGEALLVALDAHIVSPRPDREGTRAVLAVDSFHTMHKAACPGEERFVPRQTAEGKVNPADFDPLSQMLAGKRWRLLEVYGEQARVYDNQGEAHLVFHPGLPNKGRISGADGCNTLTGQYLRDGGTLRFLGLGSSLMLCPRGAKQSAAFARALSESDAWRLSGTALELFHNGNLVALFEGIGL